VIRLGEEVREALAAGFLLGGSLEEAARRGLEAAARCVSGVGSLP
jgi:sugar/nucleoside kinase (ribokinase family)